MDLHVRLEGRGDLARQIYEQLRRAILDGRLRHGDRLPPTRELARRLDVSRNTVSLAYEWLSAEGLLSGRKGAGSFIEGEPAPRSLRPRVGAPIRHRTIWDSIDAPALRERAPRFDFGVGMPTRRFFRMTRGAACWRGRSDRRDSKRSTEIRPDIRSFARRSRTTSV